LKLPERFLSSLKRQCYLSGMEREWPSFLAAFDAPHQTGIRGNLLKGIDRNGLHGLLEKMGISTSVEVSWSRAGYVLPGSLSPALAPGRHPYHHAGLFYLQEPSAMLPAEVLDARPGERVMDLCAAPGGKSTRLAEAMGGQGLLFCNEIRPDRARVLIRNLELHGVSNPIVLAEDPDRIADRLPSYFDRVLVDAPCSGEGMFRRDRHAVAGWERFGPPRCASMQDSILQATDRMLRPGGMLVYSTCTFTHEEDEGTIARFLSAHPGYTVIPIPLHEGLSPGISLPDEGGLPVALAERTVRIWPHRASGEGHFCALLQKKEDPGGTVPPAMPEHPGTAEEWPGLHDGEKRLSAAARQRFTAPDSWTATQEAMGEGANHRETHWHWLPVPPPDMTGLRVLKPGLFLGTQHNRNGATRFEPSHSILLSMRQEDLDIRFDLSLSDDRVLRYLRGETIALTTADGLPPGRIPVFLDGQPLGWARQ
jgi:16S rRNA C967 or C1407 C5-methylase (RsmB/RsmF family)